MNLLEAVNDGWSWTGLVATEIHATSPMGHLIVSDAAREFYYIDTDGMQLIALGSRADFDAHFAKDETRELWLAATLVEAARERFGEPPEGSVFTLEPMAMLQGQYSGDRMCVLPLDELIRFSGDVARQLEDLSDGSKFQIRIVD